MKAPRAIIRGNAVCQRIHLIHLLRYQGTWINGDGVKYLKTALERPKSEPDMFIEETDLFRRYGPKPMNEDSDLKTILLWTNYFGEFKYDFGDMGREAFITAGCKENRCLMTNQRGLEQVAHAFAFHRW